jgi:hypothetical protein
MDDMPFGLARQTTYAKLSPQDLESMGKQAAIAYLTKAEPSLNDAIVKLAKCHPSISAHQVRRVVEFANTEAFSRLFADNEKYASDKNIEFPVADPGDVLRDLNDGARPQMLALPDEDFHCGPVKTAAATSAVEADIALTKVFTGVDLVSPVAEKTAAQALEKTAQASPESSVDRILAADATPAGDPADRILKTAMGGPASVMMNAQPQQHPEVTHRENMRTMERRVELEKKKQELVAMQAKGMQSPGDQGGAPAPAGAEQAPAPPAMGGGGAGAEAAPAGPPMPAGPPTAGPMQQKMSSVNLTKQAMDYAKTSRPKAAAVLDDLRQATSLDNIKVAARAAGGSYPMSNPHGELIRAKQKVARLLEDARAAKDRNEFLHKEATAKFQDVVVQHVHHGGNLGEVSHILSHISPSELLVKSAMVAAAQGLKHHGFNIPQLQARGIHYEMEKGASTRVINPEHPIAVSYTAMCKLAAGQSVLNQSHDDLNRKYQEIEDTLRQAMTQNAAAV